MGKLCGFSHDASAGDFDNDGDLDLFVGNETTPGTTAPCQLFRNDGDNGFIDIAISAGVTNDRFTKGISWGDFNNDRFPDLYVSNFRGKNRLYKIMGMEHSLTLLKNLQSVIQFQVFLPGFGILIMMGT